MSTSTAISRKRKREPEGDVVRGVAPRTDSPSTTSVVDGDSVSGGDHLATAATPAATAAPPAATAAPPAATAAPPAVQPRRAIQHVFELPLSGQRLCGFRLCESHASNNKERSRQFTLDRIAASTYRKYMDACVSEGIEPSGTVIFEKGTDGVWYSSTQLNKYHPLSPHYNAAWN